MVGSFVFEGLPFEVVYYSRSRYPKGEYCRAHDDATTWNKSDWKLSESPSISESDVAVLHRFRSNVLAFMKECIEQVKMDNKISRKTIDSLYKEKQRFENASSDAARKNKQVKKRRRIGNE